LGVSARSAVGPFRISKGAITTLSSIASTGVRLGTAAASAPTCQGVSTASSGHFKIEDDADSRPSLNRWMTPRGIGAGAPVAALDDDAGVASVPAAVHAGIPVYAMHLAVAFFFNDCGHPGCREGGRRSKGHVQVAIEFEDAAAASIASADGQGRRMVTDHD
jgi:hypothetical protein